MDNPINRHVATPIPALIKRNTILFALSQSFTGAGMQFAYGLGPLMVIALTGSASLAGLSVGAIGLSRFLVAYPVGKITDTYGRKPGILLGLALAMAGALIVGQSMWLQSGVVLVGGMLVFGMGMNAAQQLRVAATDMFPPHLRAQALGYVALGALAGLMISPIAIATSEMVAQRLGQDPLALPWLMLPGLLVPSMILVLFVRPDPKEIGMNLDRYYPGHAPVRQRKAGERAPFRPTSLLRHPPTRLAILSNCAAQGNMSIIMVLTSLVLAHHGHSLTAIAMSHVFHTAGMFGFTIPLGRIADGRGRKGVMAWGVATTLIGAGLVAYAQPYWAITVGTFLVGIGWAAANVSATALIADHADTEHRGRAIGVNDSFAGGISVLTALVTGPLIEAYGLPAAGLTAVLIAAVPLLMLLAERMKRSA
jgi:MFS family permease